MTRVILSKHWKRKGANLPKAIKIAKAKSKKRYAPKPQWDPYEVQEGAPEAAPYGIDDDGSPLS